MVATLRCEDLLIGGVRRPALSGQRYTTREPATGADFGTVSDAGLEDLDEAIKLAREAQRAWGATSSTVRSKVLYRVADLIEERASEIAALDTRSSGKPIRETLGEANFGAAAFRYFAGAIDAFVGQTLSTGSRSLLITLREPIGIVAVITPYNSPFASVAVKCAPALIAGNSVIVKPSQQAPYTALVLAEILGEAGLPDGLISVLPAVGDRLAIALVEHPAVGRVSFTGSTRVGKEIARRVAPSLKRLTLELGGKSACLVFPDADLAEVAASAPEAALANAGQDCCARSRLLVHDSIRDEFIAAYIERLGQLQIGDPLEETTAMGPLVTHDHREVVNSYVQRGLDEGGELLCGGSNIYPPGL
jgi:acyl-CoA reductase-like NAD-dependent aldehyde dehydrogenase